MLEYTKYIERTLQLARLGAYYVAPNPMVGALLVDERGAILGEGWHHVYGGPHAEVECFRDVEKRHQSINYQNCTLFVSLEPCSHYGKTPPCAKLIIEKGVGHVVVGILDPNPKVAGQGIQMLRDAGIQVEVGVCEEQCRELNKRFLCLQEKKRPYVTLKWAQTQDGYLDKLRDEQTKDNQPPLVISTPLTKQIVHKMRAENMAILIGSGTALKDNPRLLTTHWQGRNPIRVLLDRRGRVPMNSRIFSDDAPTVVYRECTDWSFVLADLAKRGIHSVLVEGGAQVLQTIIQSGVWDEMHIEISNTDLGEPGVPAPIVKLPYIPTTIQDNHYMYEIKNQHQNPID